MAKITQIKGTGVVIRGHDIDTDQIIPARFMTAITFEGIEKYAFFDVRYHSDGSKKDHPFNDPKFAHANILVVNSNFGCGSSREHAPQTIKKHGIQAIIGESFAEIFAGNCTTLGVPIVSLSPNAIEEIQTLVANSPTTHIFIDLINNNVQVGEKTFQSHIPQQIRNTLTAGTWDTTNVLLANEAAIDTTYQKLPYLHDF